MANGATPAQDLLRGAVRLVDHLAVELHARRRSGWPPNASTIFFACATSSSEGVKAELTTSMCFRMDHHLAEETVAAGCDSFFPASPRGCRCRRRSCRSAPRRPRPRRSGRGRAPAGRGCGIFHRYDCGVAPSAADRSSPPQVQAPQALAAPAKCRASAPPSRFRSRTGMMRMKACLDAVGSLERV